MKTKIILSLCFSLICSLMFLGCTKDEPVDTLVNINIIGKWEIESRLTNNISNMAVLCCEFIEFKTDENIEDYLGLFQSESSNLINNGTFEVNVNDKTILIDLDNRQLLCDYSINADKLNLIYTDENNDTIDEIWKKVE